MSRKFFVFAVPAVAVALQIPTSLAGPPTPIPGEICQGKHLVIGVNDGGGFGVGQENTAKWAGFQFPPGPQHESLAIFFWGEGWKISYKERERDKIVDTTAWWQPSVGWPPPTANRFLPISATTLRNDDQACVREVVVQTSDKKLQLTFVFTFRKAYPSVIVSTTVENISRQEIFDIIYARAADYDVHQNTSNGWTSNDNAVFACGNNPTKGTPLVVMSIAGYVDEECQRDVQVFYSEEFAWDDFAFPGIRGPGNVVVKNREPSVRDGFGAVHYHLGVLRRREAKKVYTVYSAAFTDKCPVGGPIIGTPAILIPAFSKLDANEDGALSQGETLKLGLDLSRFDLKKDGKIDLEEFRLVAAARLPTFAEADTNDDGFVSQAEAALIRGLNFSSADASRDGKLDQEEYEAILLKK